MGNKKVFVVKKFIGLYVRAFVPVLCFVFPSFQLNADISPLRADATKKLLVLYPELREPFAGIYRDFVDGIGQSFEGDIHGFALGKSYIQELKQEIDSKSSDAMIALGSRSVNALSQILLNQPVLVSGVLSVDSDAPVQGGILMEPNADTYLAKLLEVHPEVRQIHVVYREGKAARLIEQAKVYLDARNIRLNAVNVSNIRQAADAYRSILSRARRGDGVWLLSDNQLLDGALLSMVLESAWDKYLAVFSANPLYVKRGALFAVYPDNVGVGRRLGKMASDLLYKDIAIKGLEPLRDVKLALNTRTSDHLGLRLSSELRSGVDLLMPDG